MATEPEDDLAPCAGTMVVALARAALKHLASRDGANMAGEDMTLNCCAPAASSSSASDQLSVALQEIASPEHPLESRLFAGLAVLARALEPALLAALTDPQLLLAFRLGARTLALCELMRQPQENGSRRASERFTDDEMAVVEATVRCYMCVALCALGGWQRAHQLSELIRDGDTSPFRNAAAQLMFKVLVACVAQLQALSLAAASRRSAHLATTATGRPLASEGATSAGDGDPVLDAAMNTLAHAKKCMAEASSDSPSSSFEAQMLRVTQLAIRAAALTERAEAVLARLSVQDDAAARDQRRLFRRLRLSKDTAEARSIQSTARDVGTAQGAELRRTSAELHSVACALWRVIADACGVDEAAAPGVGGSPQQQRQSGSRFAPLTAGCAVAAAECVRALLLIRASPVPLADPALVAVLDDINVPLARSVAAALGDASPWSLHARMTAVLALLRSAELPPPSPVVAWSLSPDVLSSAWHPPPALVARARELVAPGGPATRPAPAAPVAAPAAASRARGRSGSVDADARDDEGNDRSGGASAAGTTNTSAAAGRVVAQWSSDVMEALMLLDELVIQRERVVTLGGRGTVPPGFDDCEFLGGASKVAALVDSLDAIVAAAGDDTASVISVPPPPAAATQAQQQKASDARKASTPAVGGATARSVASTATVGSRGRSKQREPPPPLPDSIVLEARRLRAVVSRRVPVADAVAAEVRRRSPRTSPLPQTSAAAAAELNNATSGVALRKPRLSITPSGGVLKNGASVRIKVGHGPLGAPRPADATGAVELLVSVGVAAEEASARVFKAVEPNSAFVVNIGKHAPGWAEVRAILRHRTAGPDDGEHVASTVIAVAAARFYVVTFADAGTAKR